MNLLTRELTCSTNCWQHCRVCNNIYPQNTHIYRVYFCTHTRSGAHTHTLQPLPLPDYSPLCLGHLVYLSECWLLWRTHNGRVRSLHTHIRTHTLCAIYSGAGSGGVDVTLALQPFEGVEQKLIACASGGGGGQARGVRANKREI